MKKWNLFVAVLLISISAFAQGDPAKREMIEERINAQRVAFITQKLELTSAEAEKFWPVYNEFKAEEKKLKAGLRSSGKQEELSEQEALDMIDRFFVMEENMLQLQKEYSDRFLTVLPAVKVAKLRMVERAFHSEVLKQLQRRKEGTNNMHRERRSKNK